MASLDDILTTSKNIVVALNNNAQTNLNIQGTKTALGITANTLVSKAQGRLVNVIVLVAGSASGGVYDASTITLANSSNKIFSIPETVGVYVINVPIVNGIVVEPGSGQTVSISYS
jgi:hypothetical protein